MHVCGYTLVKTIYFELGWGNGTTQNSSGYWELSLNLNGYLEASVLSDIVSEIKIQKMNIGGEEHRLGLWRRKHWVDGSNLTSCIWWWTPRVRVTHRSFLFYPSLSPCFYVGWWISLMLQSDSQDTYAKRGAYFYCLFSFLLNSREKSFCGTHQSPI